MILGHAGDANTRMGSQDVVQILTTANQLRVLEVLELEARFSFFRLPGKLHSARSFQQTHCGSQLRYTPLSLLRAYRYQIIRISLANALFTRQSRLVEDRRDCFVTGLTRWQSCQHSMHPRGGISYCIQVSICKSGIGSRVVGARNGGDTSSVFNICVRCESIMQSDIQQ